MAKRENAGNPSWLLQWLRDGLGRGKGRKSQAGLAVILDLHPSQVSLMMRNERLAKLSELPAIAAYLGKELPAGLAEPPRRSPSSEVGSEEAVPAWVRIEAVIAPAVWRELGVHVSTLQDRIAPSTDPRLKGMKQYACKIEHDGKFAICVPFDQLRTAPRPSDIIHVRRTRGNVYEDTLRTVRSSRGKLELHIANGIHTKTALIYPSIDPNETIELRGLVVGYFTPTAF